MENKPSASALLILHRQSENCELKNTNSSTNSTTTNTTGFLPKFSDNELRIKSLQQVTLTGNSKLSDLKNSFEDLNQWILQPMRLASLKLNFD